MVYQKTADTTSPVILQQQKQFAEDQECPGKTFSWNYSAQTGFWEHGNMLDKKFWMINWLQIWITLSKNNLDEKCVVNLHDGI